MSRIYQIYGRDAREMTLKLLEAAEAFKLVPAGGSVALKPNCYCGDPRQRRHDPCGRAQRMH